MGKPLKKIVTFNVFSWLRLVAFELLSQQMFMGRERRISSWVRLSQIIRVNPTASLAPLVTTSTQAFVPDQEVSRDSLTLSFEGPISM